METAEVFNTISNMLMALCNIVFFCLLARDNLRFGMKATMCIWIAGFFAANIAEWILGSQGLIGAIISSLFTVLALCLYRERIFTSMAIFYCWFAMDNLMGSMTMGSIQGIRTAMQGEMTWLVMDQSGIGMQVMYCLLIIIVALITWRIMLKLKPLILDLKGAAQAVFVWLLIGVTTIMTFFKELIVSIDTYENNPGGIGLFMDLFVAITFVGTMILLAVVSLRSNKAVAHQRAIRKQELEDQYREGLTEIKEEIREREHDRRNQNG